MSGNGRLRYRTITALYQLILRLIIKTQLLVLTLLLLQVLHLEVLLSLVSSRVKTIDIVIPLMKEIYHFWSLAIVAT